METFLGLDLGGTKLLIGEVNADGVVLKHKRYESGYLPQEEAAGFIADSLDDYIHTVGWVENKPESMGIGVIGRVDSDKGVWHQIDSCRTTTINLAEMMTDRFGIACYVDNDVKSATKAEMRWGAGLESDNFVFINIGTGIASGAVINGRLLRGSNFNAGETGHMISGINLGIECCCGRKDCVELIASGSGMDTCARVLKNKHSTSLAIPESPARVNVREIIKLCIQGDELCNVLLDNATKAAADLIMDLVRCYDPNTIVLSGGIISEDYIFEKIIDAIDKYTVRFVTGGIRRTTLDPHFAGLLGASANAIFK